jgi:hypothetical protein
MNKFNIGDNLYYEGVYHYTVLDKDLRPDGWYYEIEYQEIDVSPNKMWTHEDNLTPYIEQDTKEETPQEDKPKYEVKDKVLYGGDIYEIFNISMDSDKYIYDLKIGDYATISIKEADLTLYIDRVTIEPKKCERCLESYEILQNNHLKIKDLEDTIEIQADIILQQALINVKVKL